MNGATFCSGIGAPEVAAPWIDWRLASEIEKFPRAVLRERHGYIEPADHNQGDPLLWGDMTEVTPDLMLRHGVPLPEIIVAGTPCQAFSVAGLRKGLEDPRGNLTLAFVEICHATVAARPDGKLAVLWENVPGVLSDRGNAFGAFLGGLVGADDALSPPDGGSWPNAGMVSGPRARLAWRVLDAQWFGVAQRRRRVFVVVDFGGAVDPAAVLFERQGLRGNPAPSREQGKDVTGTLSARSDGGGGLGTDFELGGGQTADWPAEIAATLDAHYGDKMGLEDQHIFNQRGSRFVPGIPTCATGDRTHALTGEGFDASEDGTGRGTPVVAFSSKDYGADAETDLSPTLRAGGHNESHANAGVPPAIAFAENQQGADRTSDVVPALSQGGGKPGQGFPAIAIQERAVSENPDAGPDGVGVRDDGAAYTLEARQVPQAVATPYAVRRLTPVECERLQGFPDDFTAIPWRGKEQTPDGPRYKALGNSMAVPVVRWIMDRMRISMEGMK